MELAEILLRAWDAGHVSDDLLRGRGVAASIDISDASDAVGIGINHMKTGMSGPHSTSSSNDFTGGVGSGGPGRAGDGNASSSGGIGDYSDGGGSGGGGSGGDGGANTSIASTGSGLSQRHPTVRQEGKVIQSYTLVPPDGTNVIAHVLNAGHMWEVRITVGAEQGIVWEFKAHPADKTEFSLRFNGALMFPEAMLASQAPNVGSIRRTEPGTYYFLFRNNSLPGRSG